MRRIIRMLFLCLCAAFLFCTSQPLRADVGGKVSGLISDPAARPCATPR